MTQSRLPVTALLGANMFFSGVTYAATMPYASLVGVDTLGMSPGWFATVMAIGSVLGTGAYWCCSLRWAAWRGMG